MSTNGSSPSKSAWPVIELPSNPKIHYDDDAKKNIVAVESLVNYCSDRVTHMQARRDLGGSDSEIEGASWKPVPLKMNNARQKPAAPSLDSNGFQLIPSPMSSSSPEIDFKDSNQIIDHYYGICEQLVKDAIGAPIVHAFDHNIRVSSGSKLDGGNTVLQQPIGVVHNDYTKVSAPRRLEQLAQPPKANDSLQTRLKGKPLLDPTMVQEVLDGKRRFVFLNVWRNIQRDSPVKQFPLACVDATTQSLKDLLTFQIIYKDRIGENYFAHWNPQHEWNYFPDMVHNEGLLIKQWDSAGSLALNKDSPKDFLSTFSLHSAFQDPTSPSDAPPRESIEVRCVLIWDKEEEAIE